MKSQKVLIPVDGSELSTQILPVIERFFNATVTDLVLFQTIEEPKVKTADIPVDVAMAVLVIPQKAAQIYQKANPINRYYEIENANLQQHNEQLQKVAHGLELRGFNTKVEVTVGNPAELILQRADEGDIDIIAMATHGRSGLSRLMMGSVAEKVLHNATLPVLLLRPEGN